MYIYVYLVVPGIIINDLCNQRKLPAILKVYTWHRKQSRIALGRWRNNKKESLSYVVFFSISISVVGLCGNTGKLPHIFFSHKWKETPAFLHITFFYLFWTFSSPNRYDHIVSLCCQFSWLRLSGLCNSYGGIRLPACIWLHLHWICFHLSLELVCCRGSIEGAPYVFSEAVQAALNYLLRGAGGDDVTLSAARADTRLERVTGCYSRCTERAARRKCVYGLPAQLAVSI